MSQTRIPPAFGDNVWIVEGPSVRFMGGMMPTRMIVVKLSDGTVWINSPVSASPETIEFIRSLGRVAYLVAPTPLHAWRLDSWHELFPDAKLCVTSKTSQQPSWPNDFDQQLFEGNAFVQETEFFHRNSQTLIVADFIQSYPMRPRDIAGNTLRRIAGVLDGGVPVDIRWTFTNRALARASLLAMMQWDFSRLVVAHGACVEHDAKAFVERAFRWLTR